MWVGYSIGNLIQHLRGKSGFSDLENAIVNSRKWIENQSTKDLINTLIIALKGASQVAQW